MIKKAALGRGLAALLPQDENAENQSIRLCPIEEIKPNRYQPRKVFKDQSIEELAASIREKGIIQPIIVRRAESGYELIAGERRWRAAQKAGLGTVPVIIKDVSPAEVLELALIENIQRADLNPLEEAEAYDRLINEFSLTQEQVAARVGKDRSTVANCVRILKLPDYIKEDIWGEAITMGHARALAGIADPDYQRLVRDKIIKKSLSVREAEDLIKKRKARRKMRSGKSDAHIAFLTEEIMRRLGTRVRIMRYGKRGKIEIEFYSEEDLERIVNGIIGEDGGT